MRSLLALLEHTSGTQDVDVWLRHAVRVWFAPDDTPFETNPDWYELTGHVERVTIRRGGQSDVDVFDAGDIEVTLDNSSGIFHPLNPDSELADDMRPGKQLWVECDDGRAYRDDFYRPDDSSDIGTLDTGELWWQHLGLAEIDSYELGFASTTTVGGDSRAAAVVDVGEGDGYVEFVVGSTAQDGMGVCFRWSNAQNGWYIRRDAANSRWRVCKLNDNVETVVTDVSAATAVGTKVRVDFNRDKVGPVTVDDVEVAASTATDSDHMMCSLVGPFADGNLTTARWSSFEAGVTQRTLFRGFVDFEGGWTVSESAADRHALATIRGIDILAMIGTVEIAEVSPAVGSAELSGARVHRILDKTSVPDAWRDIDLGQKTLVSTTFGDNALSMLEEVTLSEAGALLARANGRVWFGDIDSGIDRERTNGVRFVASDTAPSDFEDWTPARAESDTTMYWLSAGYVQDSGGDPPTDGEDIALAVPAVDGMGLGNLDVSGTSATAPVWDSAGFVATDTNTDRLRSATSGVLTPHDNFSIGLVFRANTWGGQRQFVHLGGGAELLTEAAPRFNLWDGTGTNYVTAYAGETGWHVAFMHLDYASGAATLEVNGRTYLTITDLSGTPDRLHLFNHSDVVTNPRSGDIDIAAAWICPGEFTGTQKRRLRQWAAANLDAPQPGSSDVEFDHDDDWEDFASRVVNKWQLSGSAGSLTDVEADDATSQSNFGVHAKSRDTILDTQADLSTLGTRLLNQFADPTAGPKAASVDAHDGGVRYYMAVRSELRDRHRYDYRPRGFTLPLSSDTIVDRVTHDLFLGGARQGWRCQFDYLPAELVDFGDQTSYLVLDHPELGRLDHNAWT